jgi:hypothetical protein
MGEAVVVRPMLPVIDAGKLVPALDGVGLGDTGCGAGLMRVPLNPGTASVVVVDVEGGVKDEVTTIDDV